MQSTTDSLLGGARLVFDGISGVTHIVERMHETIARRPMPWAGDPAAPTRAHGLIAAGVYGTIQTINGWLREGVDRVIDATTPAEPASGAAASAGHASFVGVLNGILGDHLEATYNPLAIRMHFRTADGVLDTNRGTLADTLPEATPHVAVLLHGLCMSERGWSRRGKDRMGVALRTQLGLTPLYLRYNTGRRISANGRELARQLDHLVAAWPVAVESITLVGHSMGGLVARSAGVYAERDGRAWRARLRSIVCLGSPHHGTPLERGGHALDRAMHLSPYVRPLALGRARSAGIQDLRHGNLVDEDWDGSVSRARCADRRQPLPLAADVAHYFAAASVARKPGRVRERIVGDLLVPVPSALGIHAEPDRQLVVARDNCRVFYKTDHLALMNSPRVVAQVVAWLRPGDARQPDAADEG